jgi:hypothetical protein
MSVMNEKMAKAKREQNFLGNSDNGDAADVELVTDLDC